MKLEVALLPIATALLPRQLDYQMLREADELELHLIDDGLCGEVIDGFLARHHDTFLAWRTLIMPSVAARSSRSSDARILTTARASDAVAITGLTGQ